MALFSTSRTKTACDTGINPHCDWYGTRFTKNSSDLGRITTIFGKLPPTNLNAPLKNKSLAPQRAFKHYQGETIQVSKFIISLHSYYYCQMKTVSIFTSEVLCSLQENILNSKSSWCTKSEVYDLGTF